MEMPGVEIFRVLLFLHGRQISTFLLSWCCIFTANYEALPLSPFLFSGAHSLFSGIGIQRYSLIHFFSSPARAPGSHRAVRCTGGERGEEGRKEGIMFHLFSEQDKCMKRGRGRERLPFEGNQPWDNES